MIQVIRPLLRCPEFYQMKHNMSVWLFLLVAAVGCISGSAQQHLSGPGPAGMDTLSFAQVYVLREPVGEFPDYWFAVGQTPEYGISANVSAGMVYCIRTLREGKNFWWTSAGDSYVLELETHRGQDIYLEMVVKATEEGKPKPELVLLDKADGEQRVNAFTGSIQYRYCELPLHADSKFAWEMFRDTVRWYVDDSHYYQFSRLPSWEIFLSSPLRATVGFRNKLISTTFSETGGIDPLPKKKFNSIEEFRAYLEKDLRGLLITSWGVSRDKVEKWELITEEVIPWATYSALMFSEVIDKKVPAEAGGNALPIRTAMVVFYWKHDSDRKGKAAILYTSERGLIEELHSRNELLNRMYYLLPHFEVKHMSKISDKSDQSK